MNTRESKSRNSADADAQEILDHVLSGTPVDQELARRIRERAEAIRGQIINNYGLQEIGVELIRDLRGPLPET